MIPWFSYYFTLKFGVKLAEIGIVFAVSQVGMALAFLIIPKVAEKIGSVRTIVYSQATSIMVLLFDFCFTQLHNCIHFLSNTGYLDEHDRPGLLIFPYGSIEE